MRKFLDSPHALGRASKWELIFWCIAAVPIVVWFKDSVPLLVFISVYAIIRTAFADWESYLAEKRSEASQEHLIEKVDEITPDPN